MSGDGESLKPHSGINDDTRAQLVRQIRRGARSAEFSWRRPSKWNPSEVRDPRGDGNLYFTLESAWEFIASRLEDGQEVRVIPLRKPKGERGLVMTIDLGPGLPELYVKIQLRANGCVLGRSFHYAKWSSRGR